MVDHDPLGVAADRVARGLDNWPVVGRGEAVLAILLQPLVAGLAMLAAVHHAAHAHHVADFEPGHLLAHRCHVAHDLVAGNAGIEGALPFRADLVEVRVADATIGNVDLHVVRAGLTARDVDGLERLISRVGAVGLDSSEPCAAWAL
ncbi:MAG TPA: hypothetical protein VHH32_04235 [Gemmatimonadales bacterium]|nr:hypothetical protein [Gemmatimonadales bacterium]